MPESALAEVLGPQVFLSLASSMLLSFFHALRPRLLSNEIRTRVDFFSSVFPLRLRRNQLLLEKSLKCSTPNFEAPALVFYVSFLFLFIFYLHPSINFIVIITLASTSYAPQLGAAELFKCKAC